uniref:Nematode cuticle collagen N-terminal domain-containing protein n=1 Tax=Parascaris univalens TaxID=6257 RepID=A0A914ZRW4_PARUN
LSKCLEDQEMNSSHQSVRNSPLDEGEPCLRKDDQSVSVIPESLPSRSSCASVKRIDYVGRCILFVLIVAVFIFGVVVAFLVGRWAANSRNWNTTISEPIQQSNTSVASTITQTPTLSITDAPEQATSFDEWDVPELSNNLTLTDIYPPSVIDTTPETFHFTSKSLIKKHRKVPLTPLPRTVLPVHYDIQLDFTAFMSEERIPGNISILLESYGNSTGEDIIFHSSANVHIDRLRLHQHGRAVLIRSVKRNARTKTVQLILKDRLKSGWCTLEIQFVTRICEDDDGGVHCYRSTPNEKGAHKQERHSRAPIISFTTKFEPTLARSFIPCWDEPHIKATFNVTVLHQRSMTVLSNTAPYRSSDKRHSSVVLTRFHETPPMSVYLLAFAVGPFVRLEMSTDRSIPLTIWTLPEDFLYARFAANFSPIMFDRHEEEFGIEYPFSKLDFVAARSFPVGGMENWGLVVFHNNMILLDSFLEDNANMTVDLLAEQYAIEKIVTHEIAHQWFGNLVTMNDWSEIWLNEGFASFYVGDFLKQDHPYLASSEYYLHLAQLLAKQTSDEKVPLVRTMRSEAEVESAFDRFHLYTKGCVIVKMIKDLVSDIDFRDGVRKDALWNSMPAYADHGIESERLEDVVEPWLVNAGMPEVIISRNYNDDSLRVTQRTSDQNRYVIFVNDVDLYSHNSSAAITVNSEGSHRWKREIHATDHLKTMRRLRRGQEGEPTPFDESLFEGIGNVSPLKDHHDPTKSEEIIGDIRKKKEKRKGRRMHFKHASLPRSQVHNSQHELKFTDLFIPSKRQRARKYRRSQHSKQLWSIPFSYRFGSSSSSAGELTRQFWLHNETMTFVDIELLPSMPLLANPDWKYPFRVNYDIDNWRMLAKMLHEHHLLIPSKSRMQLITDAEFYLKQSGVPEIYLYILGYLSRERDMGVLLIGLDAIYRFADMFRGTHISRIILIYLREVVAQIDSVLEESRSNPELAAIWLIDANRLAQLYQLRCVANLSTCEQDEKIEKWLAFADITDEDHYFQMTAVCHYLFTEAGPRELELVADGLKHFNGKWSTNIQLATCVRDEEILKTTVRLIINTKNAAVYTAVLQNEYTLHYNGKLREMLWSEIASMSLPERKLLFSIDTRDASQNAE